MTRETHPHPGPSPEGEGIYTCPMHPEVRQTEPESCPKCGMPLELAEPAMAPTKTEWTCPIHAQIVRDAPGICPICGIALEPKTVSNKPYILQQYENTAEKYSSREFIQEYLGVRRLRRKLLQFAYGDVLEVAVGTGVNLPYYPNNCRITAIDFSESMLQIAMKKATTMKKTVAFKVMDAEALQFSDRSFDTVVSTLALCTFPNPTPVLHEMARVCKVNGQILLLEHGRSDRQWLGSWQDRKVRQHARRYGCIWNREPDEIVQQAGLKIISNHRYFFGIFHLINVRPK